MVAIAWVATAFAAFAFAATALAATALTPIDLAAIDLAAIPLAATYSFATDCPRSVFHLCSIAWLPVVLFFPSSLVPWP
jgi:hypothetical protein